jgi:hypothetical protein
MSSPLSTQAAGSPQIDAAAPARGRRSGLWGRAAAVAVGLSLASCGGAIASASQNSTGVSQSARATRFTQEIRSLETRGYVQDMCTPKGTAMYNPSTHRIVTVDF